MMKYKNKDGIEIRYTKNDVQTELIKEVIGESIKILESSTWSSFIKIKKAVAFLKENFDVEIKDD